ncbi:MULTISPECIES: class II aldolase/adducin family protein [unclassified Methylophilus]|uniref:class II aldolase/adducin family protein n=1 Tax=unclassified Methylophilus TaxID=2630143 RepID=UPI0006F6995E|nr:MULTISPECIES: class II aldolase/adducin family protein [unclassified Methylophilus]KQT41778.1 fuculose phosphate aldolase [Methylophilus sp. Leaf416]KQT55944.1 fuculose phosphate aldolase [Methylophilus sp. Leaf459]
MSTPAPAMQLLEAARNLSALGLNKGTSGNASIRLSDGFLVTPSGVPAEQLSEDSMVYMQWNGTPEPGKKPSSEWRMHMDILQARPEVNAILHCHSMFATTIACLGRNVPPFHYMIAAVGGDNIRCAPYALFGTQALSDTAVVALQDRKACLLAHHGMLALGKDLSQALAIAVEVENLCEQYWRLLQLGEPKLLSAQQMQEVEAQFKDYGQWKK